VDSDPPASDSPETRRALLAASPPIYHTARLDRLTRVHPVVPPLIFVPAVVALAVLAAERMAAGTVVIAFLCGWALWTLSEYWTHRVVFHFEPDSGLGARLHWMIHGVHHDHPNDPRRLVLPPVISVPFGAAFLALFVLVLGASEGFAVCAGFYCGYLAYDMLHFALHHRRPRSKLGRLLYQLHMRHHFEDEHRGFGVSAPWWDVVFGTYSARARARSGEVRRP
jgi:sterol desaturase/sphingolipid hydroxylase (fatty acid hydroxylase superfamily)